MAAKRKQKTTQTGRGKMRTYAELLKERNELFDENVTLHNKVAELEAQLQPATPKKPEAHARLEKIGLHVPG